MVRISSKLTRRDINQVFEFFSDPLLHGVHRPSFYTVSSIIELYGSISFAFRIGDDFKAVSLNLLSLGGNEAYFYTFAVQKEEQGQGVGKDLFKTQEAFFKRINCKKIFLRVLKSNNAAYQFWLAMGFKEVQAVTGDEFSEYCMELVL